MYAGYFIIIASKKPFKTIIGKEKRSSFFIKMYSHKKLCIAFLYLYLQFQ